MIWWKFLVAFMVVVLLTFLQNQFLNFQIRLEFSLFLIFAFMRTCTVTRALIYTFILSFGLDLIFQSSQIKGVGCMGQLPLVFGIMALKEHVIPQFERIFLFTFFAIFYFSDYYIYVWINKVLGMHYLPVSTKVLLGGAVLHLVVFAAMMALDDRRSRMGS